MKKKARVTEKKRPCSANNQVSPVNGCHEAIDTLKSFFLDILYIRCSIRRIIEIENHLLIFVLACVYVCVNLCAVSFDFRMGAVTFLLLSFLFFVSIFIGVFTDSSCD